jgi:hypothetical protein
MKKSLKNYYLEDVFQTFGTTLPESLKQYILDQEKEIRKLRVSNLKVQGLRIWVGVLFVIDIGLLILLLWRLG